MQEKPLVDLEGFISGRLLEAICVGSSARCSQGDYYVERCDEVPNKLRRIKAHSRLSTPRPRHGVVAAEHVFIPSSLIGRTDKLQGLSWQWDDSNHSIHFGRHAKV